MPTAGPVHILSLDGGGTWALIQVKALISLYGDNATGHDVLRHFDVAVSNSGGSIVLAGLAANKPLASLLSLFETEKTRKRMFASLLFGPLAKKAGFGPRYRAAAKLSGLQEALGDAGNTPMREWKLTNQAGQPVCLIICGFDYERLREVFFRTRDQQLTAKERSRPLPCQQAVINATFAEAAHASSNAPVNYFNAPAKVGTGSFWDGAMGGYNNPVLAGIVEIVNEHQGRASAIRVLSIGTGSLLLPEVGTGEKGLVLGMRGECLPTYAATAGTCILDDPPDAASYVAHVMLGGQLPASSGDIVSNGPVVRMSPLIQPVPGASDDWVPPKGLDGVAFRKLAALDMDAVKQCEVKRIVEFADLWIAGGTDPTVDDLTSVRNQPIRGSRWLEVEIGHGTFGAAKRAWLATGSMDGGGHGKAGRTGGTSE